MNTFPNPRRWLRLAAALTVIAAVATPVAVTAAGGSFTDDETSVFEADINWLATTGVTRGCNPPTNDEFCPDDPVTRGQMAAFLHRLSVHKVVDAAAAVSASNATTADDADTLDGMDSTAFLGATDKAADADLLDGMDSPIQTPLTHRISSAAGSPPSRFRCQRPAADGC